MGPPQAKITRATAVVIYKGLLNFINYNPLVIQSIAKKAMSS